KDSVNIANSYLVIGHVYRAQHNDKEALLYYLKTFQLAHRIKDYRDEVWGASSLSSAYLTVNQYDSALYYGKMCINILNTRHINWSRAQELKNLSFVYDKLEQPERSDSLLKEALKIAIESDDLFLSDIQISYANKFLQKGNLDSALYYANIVKEELSINSTLR